MNIDEWNLHLEILRVAHDIYERSGRIEGHDLDNWLEAERIVKTLRKIAGVDGKRHIFVNVPRPRGEEEGEYSKWMFKSFERQFAEKTEAIRLTSDLEMLLPLADKLSLNACFFSKSSYVSFSNTCNLVGACCTHADHEAC